MVKIGDLVRMHVCSSIAIVLETESTSYGWSKLWVYNGNKEVFRISTLQVDLLNEDRRHCSSPIRKLEKPRA
jgi:hypothetical protein